MDRLPAEFGFRPVHIVNVHSSCDLYYAVCSCEQLFPRRDIKKHAWKDANDHVDRGWCDLGIWLLEESEEDEQGELGEECGEEVAD